MQVWSPTGQWQRVYYQCKRIPVPERLSAGCGSALQLGSRYQGHRASGLEEEQPRACCEAAGTPSAGQGSPWSRGPRWQSWRRDALGCAQQTPSSTKPSPLPQVAAAGGGFSSRARQSWRSPGQGFILRREGFNFSLPSPPTPGPAALPAGEGGWGQPHV